jgi:AraC-like DNA-binding protein
MPIARSLSGAAASSRPQISHEFVDVAMLRCFPQLVQQLGGDPHKLLRQARIDPALLGKAKSLIEYTSLVRVIECAARELSCSEFGLRLAAMQGGTTTISPIGVVMRNSKTLGQAIGYGARFIHAHSLPTRVRLQPDRVNRLLFVSLALPFAEMPDNQQAVEHALMLANLNILAISDGRVRGRKISFRHEPRSALKTYRDHFGCEVQFGQRADGVMLSQADLRCPVVDPDPRVYEIATSFIETRYCESESPLAERVRSLVHLSLGGKDCTTDRIAAELQLHRRTLQRLLRAEGTSFEAIKDKVRRDVALRCVREEGVTLKRLAEMLGYAETSALARSFSRWFSVTPSQLRIRLQSDVGSSGEHEAVGG